MEKNASYFLKEPVPPTGTEEWRDWQIRCRALGPACTPIFLEALEYGSESEQYAALLGLRLFGYEAFGEGYGPELQYSILAPGATQIQVIKPRITPDPYVP